MLCDATECTIPAELMAIGPNGFTPAGKDSAYQVVERDEMVCGVTLERADNALHVIVGPNFGLPDACSCRDQVDEWLYRQADDRFMDLHVDQTDGEILIIDDVRFNRAEPDAVAAMVQERLAFMFDVAYPALLGYVHRQVNPS